jgi:hypothetical protein
LEEANHSFQLGQFIPTVSVFAGANIVGKDNPYYTANAEISPKLMLIIKSFRRWQLGICQQNIIADYVLTILARLHYHLDQRLLIENETGFCKSRI